MIEQDDLDQTDVQQVETPSGHLGSEFKMTPEERALNVVTAYDGIIDLGCEEDFNKLTAAIAETIRLDRNSFEREEVENWAKSLRGFKDGIALSQCTDDRNVVRVMFREPVNDAHREAIAGAINSILLQARREDSAN